MQRAAAAAVRGQGRARFGALQPLAPRAAASFGRALQVRARAWRCPRVCSGAPLASPPPLTLAREMMPEKMGVEQEVPSTCAGDPPW